MKLKLNSTNINSQAKGLLELLTENELNEKTGIAVAINGAIIPKLNWQATELQENDDILIITATQGG